jgi:hypothetical protein
MSIYLYKCFIDNFLHTFFLYVGAEMSQHAIYAIRKSEVWTACFNSLMNTLERGMEENTFRLLV